MSDPFLVYYGEDYYLDQIAHAWARKGAVVLDGDGLTDRELVRHALSPSLDCAVTVVDNANEVSGDKAILRLVEEKSLGDPLLLVALVRDAKLTGPWLKAAKKGKSVEYKAPPDGSGGLASWVLAEAKKRGVVMTDPVAEYMVAVAGKDLRLLVRELEKLRLYMHGRVDATREDIDAVVTPHMETHAWDLCECVLQKDRRRALHLFSSLYREQGESCLMPVLYALMKQTERLLVADQMISAGATSEEIAQAIAMHPWRCKNHFIPHVKKHSAPMIREGMRHLCELDVTLKSTTASKRTHAELALCFLTN